MRRVDPIRPERVASATLAVPQEAGAGILLLKRSEHVRTHPGKWANTAGHIESGETPLQGIRRETAEEIHIPLAPGRLEKVGVRNIKDGDTTLRLHLFFGVLHRAELARIELSTEHTAWGIFQWANVAQNSGIPDGVEMTPVTKKVWSLWGEKVDRLITERLGPSETG